MFVANIEWPKVKLSLERGHNHQYDIFRDGKRVARVQKIRGVWKVARSFVKRSEPTYPATHADWVRDPWAPTDWVDRTSWRTAVLEGARHRGYGVLNVTKYRPAHITRVQVDTVWYTVVTEDARKPVEPAPGHRAPDPDPPRQYIFEDHPEHLWKPDAATAVRIRRAVAAAMEQQ